MASLPFVVVMSVVVEEEGKGGDGGGVQSRWWRYGGLLIASLTQVAREWPSLSLSVDAVAGW